MNIKIFSLGEKGFVVVKALSSLICINSITCVVGRDEAVVDDWSARLIEFCERNKIEYVFRNEIANDDKDYDLYLAVGWRWIISDVPKEKLIIFHDSLLPKYRGFSPLVNALLNKDKETGVTALMASFDYDTGNIILQRKINLNYPTSIQNEIRRISIIYGDLAVELITKYDNGTLCKKGHRQPENEASYSLWLNDEDYRINWDKDAKEILHFMSCLGWPYKGASAILNGNEVRIVKAEYRPDVAIENRSVGKTIFVENGLPVVVCGKGLLLLQDVQDQNGNSILPLKHFRSKFF
ncbi:Fmt Methionyl-tRNA formyltransferase [Methylophilaceae bacterium]